MTNSKGYRSRTRHKYKKPFRGHGNVKIGNYLRKFRLGDYVTVMMDGAIHKGMTHHFYHGRTGRVFNVNPRSVGIIFHKTIGNRKIEKRVHVRVEHVKESRCREDFLQRIKDNDVKKAQANKDKKRISTKRLPRMPRKEETVKFKPEQFETRVFKPYIEIH